MSLKHSHVSLANQPVYASLSDDHGLFMRTGQNGENRNFLNSVPQTHTKIGKASVKQTEISEVVLQTHKSSLSEEHKARGSRGDMTRDAFLIFHDTHVQHT